MDFSTDISRLIDQKVKKITHYELVDILYRQIKHMLWAEAFAATLALSILWWYGNGDRSLLLAWYGYMVLISGVPRYYLANAFTRIHPNSEKIKLWENSISGLLFISGAGWGFLGTVLLPNSSGLYQGLILFLLIIVAAAANPFYSPIKKIYAIFLIPTLFSTAIFLLLKGTNFYIFTGIAFLAFGMLMLITSIISSKLIETALFFRFQNLELTDDLLKANKHLQILATHDTLTHLPNRQFFNERLTAAIAKAKQDNKSFALMFLDLDKFKTINDTLGHDAGDQLLIVVADRLKQVIDETGRVCRLAGDEFMILIEDINNKEFVTDIAKKICLELSNPIQINNKELLTSTSIGISFFPQDGIDEETLMKNADSAMYYTKNNGGSSYTLFNITMQ